MAESSFPAEEGMHARLPACQGHHAILGELGCWWVPAPSVVAPSKGWCIWRASSCQPACRAEVMSDFPE